MRRMRIGHFADIRPDSIGGEERRLCHLKDDKKKNDRKIPLTNENEKTENQNETPRKEDHAEKDLLETSENVRKNILGSVPEAMLDVPQSILKSPAMLTTIISSDLLTDEQKAKIKDIAAKHLGKKYDSTLSLEQQLIDYLYTNDERDRALKELKPIIMEILANPNAVLSLCRACEGRRKRCAELVKIVEGKMGPLSDFPNLDLERIQMFEQLTLADRGMGFSQWLQEEDVEEIRKFFGEKTVTPEFILKKRSETRQTADISAEGGVTGEIKPFHLRAIDAIGNRLKLNNMQTREQDWDKSKDMPGSFADTYKKIESEGMELRTLLDKQLQWHAKEKLEALNNRLKGATEERLKEEKDVHAHYGTSIAAAIHETAGLQLKLSYTLRIDELNENRAKPIEDEDYLEDAEKSFRNIAQITELLDPNFTVRYLEQEKENGNISEEQLKSFKKDSGKGTEITSEGWLYSMLRKEREDHETAVSSLIEFINLWEEFKKAGDEESLEFLRDKLPPDEAGKEENIFAVARRLRAGEATAEDHEYVYERCVDGAINIKKILFLARNPSSRIKSYEVFQKAKYAGEDESMDKAGTEAKLNELREKFESCEGMRHQLCKVMGFSANLNREFEKIQERISRGTQESMRSARERISVLESCLDDLNDLYSNPERTKKISGQSFGNILNARGDVSRTSACYSNGVIYINEPVWNSLDNQTKSERLEHERGHAILDIFTRRTGLMFDILQTAFDQTKDGKMAGSENRFGDLLKARAKDWAISVNEKDPRFAEALMEELIVRYSDWIRRNKPTSGFSSEDLVLFKWMEKPDDSSRRFIESTNKDAALVFAAPPESEGGDGADAGTERTQSTEGAFDVNQAIRSFEGTICEVSEFLKAYPTLHDIPITSDAEINGAEGTVTLSKDIEDIKKYLKEKIVDPVDRDRSLLGEVKQNCGRLSERLGKWKSFMSKTTMAEMQNVYNAQKERRNIIDMIRFGEIQMLSIMDIWKTAMSIKEDWIRMWKRRGEHAQAKFGKFITRWIPEQVPYAGRLHNEFNRREQQSELAEVQQYRDALKNMDNFALMARIGDPEINNKDEIKAVFEELAHRGRINWQNKAMWRKLAKLSGLPFPIGPCENDDVLRDKWLQHCISEIWNDKSLYNSWRRENDSGIKRGKSEVTDTVKQLSNVSGGMEGELERQLRLWVMYKESAEKPPQINSHLYEEVIHYGIRVGKMSMEQKFYYLVRGVAEGLLSIDRLRVLAGDEEVVPIFPYIDYFYKKNNSFAFITSLAKKLTETENGADTFRPGTKSTMFVRLVIAREQAVKERLKKDQSKVGEKIDHDDIPYFLPDLDFSAINDWYARSGGDRQKTSTEARKNSYVGYNMKLKSFAALSLINNGNNISDADINDLVTTITAYICSDNVLTKNGYLSNQPSLSENEINFTRPVCGGARTTVASYRNPLNDFTKEVCNLLPDSAWENMNKQISDPKPELRVTKENFTAGREIEINIARKELAENISKATGRFQAELQKYAMTEDGRNAILELLRRYGQTAFINDGMVTSGATMESMRDAYLQFMGGRSQAAAA
ncbi:MAG: hypothetical protein UW70_C0031G0005 [Candidatus Peregrinibacteria bacterium GW2011_GWA2_44_7]|nr:MAG: hypothetical protein UW70_C0031G0005 [Candidatus Peregrinibacteria bacterium GW2011_GWA2_44_7]